jgi:hypothetical protein
MKKLTAPDATAMPGKKADKVLVRPVKTNPPRKAVRPRGWVA